MARGTRTVYPSERNKRLRSTFQPPEEAWSVQRPKRFDKHRDKDEDNSPKNINNVPNGASLIDKVTLKILWIIHVLFPLNLIVPIKLIAPAKEEMSIWVYSVYVGGT